MNAKQARRLGIPEPREVTAVRLSSQPFATGTILTGAAMVARYVGKNGGTHATKAEARETFA
jgi:hypothetical protein